MRVIHLCFRLGMPEIATLQGQEESDFERNRFKQYDQEIIQPFLALLERNMQREAHLHVSLFANGRFWEQAEVYAPELIERFGRLIKRGQVELIATSYYDSWSFFYDRADFADQVELHLRKVERLFGVKCQILAGPDWVYDDAMAQWAEEHNFAVMLAKVPQTNLRWRTANRVYEASGCQYLRLLFNNERFEDLLTKADRSPLLTILKSGKDKSVQAQFSLPRFRKELGLENLRGSLLNLFLDADVFVRFRDYGIVGLFDEMFRTLNYDAGYRFVNASEACVFEVPSAAVSINRTSQEKSAEQASGSAMMVREEREALPHWLMGKSQQAAVEMLRRLREQVDRVGNRDQQRLYRALACSQCLANEEKAQKVLADLENLTTELGKAEVEPVTSREKAVDALSLEVVDQSDQSGVVQVLFAPAIMATDSVKKAEEEDCAVQVKILPRSQRTRSRNTTGSENNSAVKVKIIKSQALRVAVAEPSSDQDGIIRVQVQGKKCASERNFDGLKNYTELPEAEVIEAQGATDATERIDDSAMAFAPIEVPTLRLSRCRALKVRPSSVSDHPKTKIRRKTLRRSLVIE